MHPHTHTHTHSQIHSACPSSRCCCSSECTQPRLVAGCVRGEDNWNGMGHCSVGISYATHWMSWPRSQVHVNLVWDLDVDVMASFPGPCEFSMGPGSVTNAARWCHGFVPRFMHQIFVTCSAKTVESRVFFVLTLIGVSWTWLRAPYAAGSLPPFVFQIWLVDLGMRLLTHSLPLVEKKSWNWLSALLQVPVM